MCDALYRLCVFKPIWDVCKLPIGCSYLKFLDNNLRYVNSNHKMKSKTSINDSRKKRGDGIDSDCNM